MTQGRILASTSNIKSHRENENSAHSVDSTVQQFLYHDFRPDPEMLSYASSTW